MLNRDITEATDYLNAKGIAFGTRGDRYLTFNVHLQQLKDNKPVHEWIVQKLAPRQHAEPTGR